MKALQVKKTVRYNPVTWFIDGIRLNGKLDRLNRELALQDALEFERCCKALAAETKKTQRELRQADKVLRRAVKVLP